MPIKHISVSTHLLAAVFLDELVTKIGGENPGGPGQLLMSPGPSEGSLAEGGSKERRCRGNQRCGQSATNGSALTANIKMLTARMRI